MAAPSPEQLADLSLDLHVEIHKLQRLIGGIQELDPLAEDPLRVDAAALRLQSLYTGIERCLLERMGQPTVRRPAVLSPATIADLQELLRFRHLVRHLYAYELKPEPVERLRCQALTVWPRVKADLEHFRRWLATVPGDGDGETSP